jgi:hypothetical protein
MAYNMSQAIGLFLVCSLPEALPYGCTSFSSIFMGNYTYILDS